MKGGTAVRIYKLMEKTERRQYRIVSLLHQQSQAMALKEIVSTLGFSKATVLKYIELFNERAEAEQFAARISVSELDVCLHIAAEVPWQAMIGFLMEPSARYQILLALFYQHSMSVTKMTQTLLISEATFNRHLVTLNQLLASYNISIANGRLRGPEQQIRYFFYELFWHVWSAEQLQQLWKTQTAQQDIELLSRLFHTPLTLEQQHKLALCFAITKQRVGVNQKDFTQLHNKMRPYQDHRFFGRIKQVVARYFGHFAIELDAGEPMWLFAFLVSSFVLPVQTTEYILGFGGPVVEAITVSIRQLRTHQLGDGYVDEQLTYVLAQLFGRVYFFTDCLVLDDYTHQETALLQQKFISPAYVTLAQDICAAVRELFQQTAAVDDDLYVLICWELVQLIGFLMAQAPPQIVVAVDVANDVHRYMIMQLLADHLAHNRLIVFEPYCDDGVYDMVISNNVVRQYEALPVYYLKGYVTPNDVTDLSRLLLACLHNR